MITKSATRALHLFLSTASFARKPTATRFIPLLLPPPLVQAAVEVHVHDPAREGYFPAFSTAIGGPVQQFDPPQSYWGLASPRGGGASTYK